MSSLDDLAIRCGSCAEEFGRAGEDIRKSHRVLEEIVDEPARPRRRDAPKGDADEELQALIEVNLVNQRLSMMVLTLQTAASVLDGLEDSDTADQVIDALEAGNLDLDRLGTSVTSYQEHLVGLTRRLDDVLRTNHKGQLAARYLEQGERQVTLAASSLTPLIADAAELLTHILAPYDEPVLQRYNATAAAHDAIDTLTDLIAFGQNVRTVLQRTHDRLSAAEDLLDEAIERAESSSTRQLKAAWENSRRDIENASEPVRTTITTMSNVLTSVDHLRDLGTRGAIIRVLDDDQARLGDIHLDLTGALQHARWVRHSLPIRTARRDPAWLIRAVVRSAEAALLVATGECTRFTGQYGALVTSPDRDSRP